MACGATLKRHREFDPLQSSPDRSPKRLCLPIDIMAPASHSRLLSGPAFVEVAHKLIQDQLAARMAPGRERQPVEMMSCHTQMNSVEPSTAVLYSPLARNAWLSNSHKPVSRPLMQNESSKAPRFTMSQVQSVCKSIVKEREERIREEFDNILANKLAEQYEGFLRFNQELIHKKFDSSDASYVS